jgi:hypothetical protein
MLMRFAPSYKSESAKVDRVPGQGLGFELREGIIRIQESLDGMSRSWNLSGGVEAVVLYGSTSGMGQSRRWRGIGRTHSRSAGLPRVASL